MKAFILTIFVLIEIMTLSSIASANTNLSLDCTGIDIMSDVQMQFSVVITPDKIYLKQLENIDAAKYFPALVKDGKVEIAYLENYNQLDTSNNCSNGDKPTIGFDYIKGIGRLYVGCGKTPFQAIKDSKCQLQEI